MILFVPINHSDRNHLSVVKRYEQKARNGECAVFLEGFPAGKIQGKFFGVEDDLANAITGVLLHLGYCRSPELKKEAIYGNAQTILDIASKKVVREAWDQICPKIIVYDDADWKKLDPKVEFYNEINNFIEEHEKKDLKTLANEIIVKLSKLLEEKEKWKKLYIDLFFKLLEAVPKELKAPFQNEKVAQYVLSGENKHSDYIVFEINNKWRNDFIVKNILETIRRERLKGKIYIFIGAMHVQDLKEKIEKNNYPVQISSVESLN